MFIPGGETWVKMEILTKEPHGWGLEIRTPDLLCVLEVPLFFFEECLMCSFCHLDLSKITREATTLNLSAGLGVQR